MANLYDLKKFDLNLLVIFECIFQHLSISKAAETLYITPSAVSQSLQRLRSQLNDPLFIRSGKGITPTTVGINLHHHLEQNLNQLEQTINIMHGSALEKNFILYCPQILTTENLLDPLKLLMREHNYQIELHDMLLTADSAEDLLAYRKADLIFSMAPVNNRSMICMPYASYSMIMVCSQDHPRMKDVVTMEELNEEKFTVFMSDEPGVKSYQSMVEKVHADKKIGFRCDSVFTIMAMISASHLVGYVPEIFYEKYKQVLRLKKLDAPFMLPPLDVFMIYNRSALNSSIFSSFIGKVSEN
ncbi:MULTISPECIES: LysR family transcriptional regulator [unclassified Enterobacter cloacae complex]|uniref:DNA-binding transcriptional repressor CitR n=1 Tax=unclassified Enterobacter cloacae complex TaxID=2757714 RepID=UPI001872594D|nr:MULTISPECIES: LysR family transcriptional regulator [unclassified Enterobacter cloacae complex]HDS2774364.1 LysR family transcriptional regulator [Enterobacter bugandensis]MBE4811988.1 LysR family transcriptional regulator [Enterobacter cloacae complex sp. P44RS]MBE4829171.1 LysR family transcriptional regulator [Enterobacter cloacae complex sp. P42RS]MBE4838293.1 LysR family transcriptional regulator [Enterobacter cloacae complex sp. P46RS]MBE4842008.1 LysR family transcriptional regulator